MFHPSGNLRPIVLAKQDKNDRAKIVMKNDLQKFDSFSNKITQNKIMRNKTLPSDSLISMSRVGRAETNGAKPKTVAREIFWRANIFIVGCSNLREENLK